MKTLITEITDAIERSFDIGGWILVAESLFSPAVMLGYK